MYNNSIRLYCDYTSRVRRVKRKGGLLVLEGLEEPEEPENPDESKVPADTGRFGTAGDCLRIIMGAYPPFVRECNHWGCRATRETVGLNRRPRAGSINLEAGQIVGEHRLMFSSMDFSTNWAKRTALTMFGHLLAEQLRMLLGVVIQQHRGEDQAGDIEGNVNA